ncbi:MAG TPA: protein TolA [Arenimonas sp.]|nr:protein TolA [Arenimonas sp.]
MVADGYFPRRADPAELWVALGWALLLHVGLALLLVLAGWWKPVPKVVSVAGPVIEAALVVTSADIQRAEQAAAEAPQPEPAPAPPQREAIEEAAPPPQPTPEPKPQTSPEPPQTAPQQPLEDPATVEQERIARLAEEKAEREKQEQEAKRRQEQVDLTERKRQEEVERRQRLLQQQREQLEAIRREREAAAKATKLAEDKLKQLADRQPAAAKPAATATPTPAAPVGGNNGTDTDLRSRYVLAMNQTAQANWNRALAPEGVPCRVTFIQIIGGDVIDVRFQQCPFDAQGRESVERALKKTPMPYAGFETVFAREVSLTMCYPQEACPR